MHHALDRLSKEEPNIITDSKRDLEPDPGGRDHDEILACNCCWKDEDLTKAFHRGVETPSRKFHPKFGRAPELPNIVLLSTESGNAHLHLY